MDWAVATLARIRADIVGLEPYPVVVALADESVGEWCSTRRAEPTAFRLGGAFDFGRRRSPKMKCLGKGDYEVGPVNTRQRLKVHQQENAETNHSPLPP